MTYTPDISAATVRDAALDGVGAGQALQHLLSFSHAQALLVGLSGCTPGQATNALRVTAEDLGIGVEDLLGVFDDLMSGDPSTHFEAILVRLLAAVRTADGSDENTAVWSSHTDSATTDSLPTHVICGGPVSLGHLFDVYGAQCYGVARHIVGNDEQLAAAVVRDVFLSVAHGDCWFDARRGTVGSWLLLTTRAVAIRAFRTSTVHRSRLGQ